ncbi:MAG: RDD family protein [Blastocatellia bacterium]
MRARRDILAFNHIGKLRAGECLSCGAAVRRGMGFCSVCGSEQACVRPRLVLRSRPGILRRVLAEIIDRLVPLPFLTYLFPLWIWVVVAYHLLCDGSPSGQSVGKWVCRLCVISTASGEPCGIWRAMLRRLPTALGQAAYCAWMMIPLVIAFELVSLAFVWLNPTGRRLEDYFTGTQVITRNAYGKLHRCCALCGERLFVGAKYCPQCGQPSKINSAEV